MRELLCSMTQHSHDLHIQTHTDDTAWVILILTSLKHDLQNSLYTQLQLKCIQMQCIQSFHTGLLRSVVNKTCTYPAYMHLTYQKYFLT